jgi:hypothetical protein
MEVSPVNPLPKTYQYTDSVSKVITTASGKDKVIQTNYIVTVYDKGGVLTTTSTNHSINYLI